jgi:stage II sporulation protein D
MHKVLHGILCLTVAFVTLFASVAAAESLSDVSVESAPLSSQQPTLDGMVRVYLASLGSPTSLTLTVSGSYSLSDGTALTSGESLSVSFNSSNGVITLTRGGAAYSMGNAFTLRRHSTTGSNGIKIAQARKPENLYPGDIQFKAVAQNSGGYKLYTIAHIYIENYLYGVVPYEMGSSAPLEALKAQAVAARTYTVRMMSARSSWLYDVVDTTGDQTYNGTPTSTSNCNTAVDGTKGILIKNGSNYTATYYSSSDGGQTEAIKNAWGTNGYAYLGVKDDPFDYANPASVVKQATVYGDAANASNSSALLALLKTKAVSVLASAGYNATANNTTIQTIKSISANTPMYASPSRLYTKMDFTLSANTCNSSNVSVSVTTTVTCDIFGELESLLNMSIQSGSNELWSVVTSGSTFKLQARRYGHGIGMSQRGAMYMGQLGFTYDEILGFYYPGCTRIGGIFTNTILSPGSSETITTSEDPVSIEDGASEPGVRGIVTLSNDSQLAVRGAKSSSASVLTVLSNGTPVDVLANDGTWCLIQFGSIIGYVPTASLSLLGTAPQSDGTAVTSIAGFAVVAASGYLNLRATGGYSASILTTAPNGAILTVLSWDSSWAYVQYGKIVGYAASEYLTFSASYPAEIQEPGTDTGDGGTDGTALSAIVATQNGSLNMRQFPQAGSKILTTIPQGAVVSVTEKGDTWSAVTYSGTSGYVMTTFLSFAGGTDEPQGGATVETTATVATQSGSLNLRQLPQAGSAIYCTIPRGSVISVLSKGSEWCQVTYTGTTGYVMTAFLSFQDPGDADTTDGEDDTNQEDGESTIVTAVVATSSGSLNMRAEAQFNSRVLMKIPQGVTITVLQRLSAWTYTSYQDVYGYVLNSFLTFSSDKTGETEYTTPVSAVITTELGSLNLRDEPYGNVVGQIPQLAAVEVLKRGSAWCSIRYNGVTGYVMTVYLSFDTSDADTGDTDGGESDQEGASNTDSSAQATSATVTVESGSLNLRSAKSDTASVLTTIPNGTVVPLLLHSGDWCKVTYGSYQGYVQTKYLTLIASGDAVEADNTADASDTNYSLTAWVNTTSGSLNLRETTSANAAVVAQIPQYTQVEVLSDIQATWCRVSYGNELGYVLSEYLTTTEPDAGTGNSESGNTDTGDELPMDPTLHKLSQETLVFVRPAAGSTTLALYEACSEDSELLQNMPENSQLEIVQAGDTWCEVIYTDQSGYCMRDSLSFFEDE